MLGTLGNLYTYECFVSLINLKSQEHHIKAPYHTMLMIIGPEKIEVVCFRTLVVCQPLTLMYVRKQGALI